MRFGTWNIGRLYGSGTLTTVAREISMYKLDIVGVQEVMWDNGGTVTTVDYTFFLCKKKRNETQLATGFLVRYRRVQAGKTVESVSHKCYIYIVLRGRWLISLF
jgi:endonuclease/exonuclease/phosphatase family metal-dependent hydrolase